MTFPKWRIAMMIRQRSGTTSANSTTAWPRSLSQAPPAAGALSAFERRLPELPRRAGVDDRRARSANPSCAARIWTHADLSSRPRMSRLRGETVELAGDAAEEVADPVTQHAEVTASSDDEEADHHRVLGRALTLLALETPRKSWPNLSEIRSNIPYLPFELAGRHESRRCLTRSIKAAGLRALRTAKGWVGPPLRISVRVGAMGDNRAVADHIDLARSDGRRLPRTRRRARSRRASAA